MDRNEKVWAYTGKGKLRHAFTRPWVDKDGVEHADYLRALCRGTITRDASLRADSWDDLDRGSDICNACCNKFFDEVYREPATEADDLGYVAPAGKFTDTQRDSMQDAFDAAVEAAQAPKTDAEAPMDELHAEALEMDSSGEALTAAHRDAVTLLEQPQPARWHYRAVLATTGGTPLDGIEGYLNAIDRDAAETALQERFATDLIRLTSLHINPA